MLNYVPELVTDATVVNGTCVVVGMNVGVVGTANEYQWHKYFRSRIQNSHTMAHYNASCTIVILNVEGLIPY